MEGVLAALVANMALCPPVIGVSGTPISYGTAPQTLLMQVMMVDSGTTDSQGQYRAPLPTAFPNGLFGAIAIASVEGPYAVIVSVMGPGFSDVAHIVLQFYYGAANAPVVGANLAQYPQFVLAFGW